MQTITTDGPDPQGTAAAIIRDKKTVLLANNLVRDPDSRLLWTGNVVRSTPAVAANLLEELLERLQYNTISPLWRRQESVKGKPPVILTDVFSYREKLDWPDYEKACRDGTIAFNPYKVYTGLVRAGKQRKITSETFGVQSFEGNMAYGQNLFTKMDVYEHKRQLLNSPFRHPLVLGSVPWFLANVSSYGDNTKSVNRVVTKRTIETVTVAPLQKPVQEQFEGLASSMLLDIDDVLITEALSKANDREIDVLTTLAELPKTITSVISGLKLMTKITKDARKREFAISQSQISLKENKMKLAYKQYLSKTKRGRKHKTLPFDKWAVRNEQRFAAESVTEILDAISGVWMTYRYEIRPLVYTIQDAASALDKFENQYITTRTVQTRQMEAPKIEGYTFQGSCSVTHRVWIKRRYDVSEAISKLNKVIMADVFVTAYELIPIWSIVADWFFTIGPALRALQFNTNYQSQAATYSVKTEIKGMYTLDSDTSIYNEVEFVGYKRSKINPARHITIQYVNNFDDLKAFDSLGFFWGSIGRKRVNNLKYKEVK